MVKPFTVRRAAGLALAAAAALALSACGSSASSPGASSSAGGVYNVGLTTPTGTIDPLTVADYYAMYVVGLASANLIIESPSGKLEPQLATSWTQSPDKLSWTINLRPNAKFSTGKPVTAGDVLYTFDQILGASSQSPAKSSFTGIVKSVAAGPGGTSVVFKLAQPYSDFPYLLTGANTWILPSGTKDANWINHPVGAGQFILEKYTPRAGRDLQEEPVLLGRRRGEGVRRQRQVL